MSLKTVGEVCFPLQICPLCVTNSHLVTLAKRANRVSLRQLAYDMQQLELAALSSLPAGAVFKVPRRASPETIRKCAFLSTPPLFVSLSKDTEIKGNQELPGNKSCLPVPSEQEETPPICPQNEKLSLASRMLIFCKPFLALSPLLTLRFAHNRAVSFRS